MTLNTVVTTNDEERRHSESDGAESPEHDPQFEPIVSIPVVEVSTNEENEEELCKIRARLYRFNSEDHEWKERGTGDIKLLRHKDNNSVRVVMRRDHTFKVCANHFITPDIQLKPHCGSDKAFNWSVIADFADETPKTEVLAIRFRDVENALLWKTKFEEAIVIVKTKCRLYNGEGSCSEEDDEDDSADSVNKTSDSDVTSPESDKPKTQDSQAEVADKLSKLTVDTSDDKVSEQVPK